MNVLTKEVQGTGFSPLDAVMVAGAKIATENLLSRVPLVGNGTLRSGAIKVAGAVALTTMVKNKVGSIVGTAMMVDGGEDLVRGVLALLGKGNDNNGSSVVGGQSSNQNAGIGVSI